MKIIAIAGKKRSGKDTVGMLIDEIGRENNKRVNFVRLADKIKEALKIGYEENQLVRVSGIDLTNERLEGIDYDRESPLLISNKDACDLIKSSIGYLQRIYALKNPEDKSIVEDIIKDVVFSNKESWSVRRLMQTLGTDVVVNRFDKYFWCRLTLNEIFDKMDHTDICVIGDIRQVHEQDAFDSFGATFMYVSSSRINNITDTHITEQGLSCENSSQNAFIYNDGSLEDLKPNVAQQLKFIGAI
ncbi:gp1 dNMP kinase [Acinetobacter phage Ac42]|uniref:gp1 dNMP kinase n=1 Tax=Acinetobacter phage Ac42 TaxID=762660 RepID=UPI0001EBCD72|nr:gp1 dNMP kinase [Acinetobacter phage Ac42]ADI96393.1 gp1 dNMP kinase [Acinetobacter phage Ac42]